jgi:hypothetical protein
MNRYEIHFDGEKIGDASNFEKAMEIGYEILDTIKKYPKETDEYQLLQIRCYHWLDRLFRRKNHVGMKSHRYTIVVWSETEKKYVVNKR